MTMLLHRQSFMVDTVYTHVALNERLVAVQVANLNLQVVIVQGGKVTEANQICSRVASTDTAVKESKEKRIEEHLKNHLPPNSELQFPAGRKERIAVVSGEAVTNSRGGLKRESKRSKLGNGLISVPRQTTILFHVDPVGEVVDSSEKENQHRPENYEAHNNVTCVVA